MQSNMHQYNYYEMLQSFSLRFKGRLETLLKNIRLAWKTCKGTHTLAYFEPPFNDEGKKFSNIDT